MILQGGEKFRRVEKSMRFWTSLWKYPLNTGGCVLTFTGHKAEADSLEGFPGDRVEWQCLV